MDIKYIIFLFLLSLVLISYGRALIIRPAKVEEQLPVIKQLHILSNRLYNFAKNIKKKYETAVSVVALIFTFFIIGVSISAKYFPNNEDLKYLLEKIHFLLELIIPICIFVVIMSKKIIRASDPMKAFFPTLFSVISDLIRDTKILARATETEIHNEVCRFFQKESDDFSIVDVDDDNLPELHKIVLKGWDNYTMSRSERVLLYTSWYEKNPKIFSLILNKEKEVIGYLSLLPLIDDEHFSGKKERTSILPSEIIRREDSPQQDRYIYLEGMYVEYKYQTDKGLAELIYKKLIKKIYHSLGSQQSFLYADAKYASLGEALEKLGFGHANKLPSLEKSRAKYIPFLNKKEIKPGNRELYKLHYEIGKCRHTVGSTNIVFHSVDYVGTIEKPISFEPSFEQLISDKVATFNINSEVEKSMINKDFLICFHTTYINNIDDLHKEKNHHFTTAKFRITDAVSHFMICELVTFTHRDGGRFYKYTGLACSDKKKEEFTFILYPKEESGDDKNWHPYGNAYSHPIIIRANIMKADMQPISYSYYSFQHNTHRSKIALLTEASTLGINYEAKSIPLVIEDGDSVSFSTAKKFLMRGNKVSIATIFLNNNMTLEKWMDNKFQNRLGVKNDNEFLLLYFKRSQEGIKYISTAKIEFYNNGIAKFTRKYKTKSYNKIEDRTDTYYGEFNIRHKELDGKYIYLKLIKMNFDENRHELSQEYREIFITLFWPKEAAESFDFTRGIITSDKDVEVVMENGQIIAKNSQNSMSANICLLCNINENWTQYFGEHNPFNNFNEVKPQAEKFLEKVVSKSTDKNPKSTNNCCIDIIMNEGYCVYESFMKS